MARASRLTRTAREMVEAAGVDPENIFAYLYEEAELAADLVKLRMQDFIDDDLVDKGQVRSLEGYKVEMREYGSTEVEIGGQTFRLPSYELSVAPSFAHRFVPGKRELNIFNILDQGREALPRKPKGKWYPLWGNIAGGGLNVPTSNQRVRDARGRFTTQFRAVNRFQASVPSRPEPRKGPGNEPRLSKDELRGVKFFGKGPYPAVPPRNLYKRMLAAVQRDLKNRDLLPIEIRVELDGD